MTDQPQRQPRISPCAFQPCESEVRALISKAGRHELGTDFLKTGALDSVAAMFEVHAFVVEAARARLDGVEGSRPHVETMATAGAPIRG